jgi:ABC-type sugar transport system permease subunit
MVQVSIAQRLVRWRIGQSNKLALLAFTARYLGYPKVSTVIWRGYHLAAFIPALLQLWMYFPLIPALIYGSLESIPYE